MAFDQYDRSLNENQKFANYGTDKVTMRVTQVDAPDSVYSEFTDIADVSYTTSGDESNITLNRGTTWRIKEVHIYSSKGVAGSDVQIFDLNAASSTNQRDPAHADSEDILMGQFQYANVQALKFDPIRAFATGLRIRFNGFGSVAHTIYVTVKYVPI